MAKPTSSSDTPIDLEAQRARRLRSFGFLARFVFLLALFYLPLLYTPIDTKVVEPFTRGVAVVSAGALNLLGQGVVRSGTLLSSGPYAVSIRNGCNGVEAMSFLAAATLAFPAPWRRRISAALLGMLLVQVLNLVRVVTLFLIQRYHPSLFSLFHLTIWQTIIGGSCIAFFYLYTSRAAAPVHASNGG
jgi:exosortase H (IPTLxxWG-CTERM-specific)